MKKTGAYAANRNNFSKMMAQMSGRYFTTSRNLSSSSPSSSNPAISSSPRSCSNSNSSAPTSSSASTTSNTSTSTSTTSELTGSTNHNNFTYNYNNNGSICWGEGMGMGMGLASPLSVRSARFRSLATSVFHRRFVTHTRDRRSNHDQGPAGGQIPVNTVYDLGAAVANLVDAELKESEHVTSVCSKFLKENNYKLDVSDGIVTMTRRKGKQLVEIKFSTEEQTRDEEQTEDNEESETETEVDELEAEEETAAVSGTEANPEVEEDADEESFDPNIHDVEHLTRATDLDIPADITITTLDKSDKVVGVLTLDCAAQPQGIYVNAIYSHDQKHSMDFAELSDDLRAMFLIYLEQLEIDNSLGNFISNYVNNFHTHKSVVVLKDLKQFILNSMKDE